MEIKQCTPTRCVQEVTRAAREYLEAKIKIYEMRRKRCSSEKLKASEAYAKQQGS